jgi:hypothetical protein
MRPDIVQLIRGNPALNHYLRYHSYWYKELIRNPSSLKILEQEMKKEYKLTTEDKINKINDRMNMIATFLNVMK